MPTVTLLLFAAARDAAGTRRDDFELSGGVADVAAVLDAARARYGPEFSAVLDHSRVWCNGEPATPASPVSAGDEVAVLPPVSGGCGSGSLHAVMSARAAVRESGR